MKTWRHQPLTIRLLAGSAVALTAAAALAAPAEAGTIDDAFIGALNDAGVNYGDPASAVDLGHSVCSTLAQPGGTFNSAAATVVAAGTGMPKSMAQIFTSIAISTYCPQAMTDVATGNLPGLPQIPGIPGF
ncbi:MULTISPECIES: DUF732 domain-containing protein [Mycobacterium]|uniref:Lipoprotein LprJ n=1 Tax=Mycobacterium persicum TaxID=1487726 RepID=A0A1X0LEB5_9MYCO|nr:MULTISPECIES: DUF732 domain-containing protein [Mycobacterium]KZS84373.1 hypothetical protein A4G31_18840 [Mycobacterium persicum]ORB52067.1 hypothetical protein BST40_09655 [Mycobacterium persicum]ORB91123.1 hypothetical protein B1T49_19910 [Mycobacterium persicum]ORB96423.1 hypothetical protein B1T44_20155 [Mycobacterium persicum]ORC03120.1 hypothetical protein B1T48_19600 [Mycobacterium persicum]